MTDAPLHPKPVSEVDVAIVGGGAAGLMTAIAAVRGRPGRVAVLDGAARFGAKILISGGGRCNVTNRSVSVADFHGGSRQAIARVLKALPVPATVAFFESLGVALHEEANGKLFPDTGRARTVLDALLRAAADAAALWPGQRVDGIERGVGGFVLRTARGPLRAARVVLATGGLSVPGTGSDGAGLDFARALGHSIVPTTPALVPLLLDGDAHAALAGVTHPATLTLEVGGRRAAQVTGSLLWTHTGVSGPAALDISRHWHRASRDGARPVLSLNLHPGSSFEQVDAELLDAATARPRAALATVLSARLPSAVATQVVRAAGIEGTTPMAHLQREDRRRLVHGLVGWRLVVTGSRGYAVAEATAGGVALDEIDPATMSSRVCPGLYLVGEVLDVDGRLGGFNFQWAWASGTVAGHALGQLG